MAERRIASTGPLTQSTIDMLSEVAVVEIAPSGDENTMMGMLENTIGLVARGEGRVTKRMIEACPSLRVIGRSGAGYDTVDVAEATKRKIPVVHAPVSAFAVAEGTLAMLMTLVKRIPFCDRIVKAGRWQERYEFATGDMTEHTLGIIGLGRIGSSLAKLVQPFDMNVLGYDPAVSGEQGPEMGVEIVGLDELLGRSDYVSLHVPLTDQTRGLINRDRVARMKKGAILINTARGGIVESLDVLADGLETGQLGAVGLDVFLPEPPDVSHRIFKHSNCVCAPHMLGVSELAMERIGKAMAQGMVNVLSGRKPPFCVNPEVLQ